MPAFDLISFARQLLAPASAAEVLACAGRAAVEAQQGSPAFVAHVVPGRNWEQTLLFSVEGVSAAARSALFAVYRRLAQQGAALTLERGPEHETVFRALAPQRGRFLDALPLRSRDQRLIGMLVTARSAEEAKRSQLEVIAELTGTALETSWRLAAARRDQERMHLFSETADEALWDWSVLHGEIWWGGGLEALFGAGRGPSKRPRWRDAWLEPELAREVNASFDAACAGTGSSWSQEYLLRRGDGTFIEVLERAYFLREADGRAYRVIGTLRDVSALKEATESEKRARTLAEQASNVKDEFLAMLGHELRNPLAPILSSLELLERRASKPDPQLAVLRRQAQHLVRLVDDLLDVSRISRGKIDLMLRPLALGALVLRAVEMAQPLITLRGHHLELDVEDSLVLLADEARVAQVLANLLTNAAKYTQPAGKLWLSAHADGSFAAIRVRDNGIGIAREMLPHVFDMFVQGRQAIDRADGGLGLGLTIARNIVRLHGGTVEAHSEGHGKGAELVVRLPLATVPADAVVDTPRASPTMTPRRLLIIDDNEDAAVMLGEVLSAQGHSVQIVHHPAEALRVFSWLHPDIAVIDIGLPTMDGYELVRRLRAQPGGDTARFIAVTGYGQQSDREKAAAAGFDAHLVKPVAPDRLEALIAELGPHSPPDVLVTGT